MEKMEFFKSLASGAVYGKDDSAFMEFGFPEMIRSRQLCFRINGAVPFSAEYSELMSELFACDMEGRYITAPLQVDYGCQIHLGRNIYINDNFSASAYGGITIEDGARLGAEVMILTLNHDLAERDRVQGKPVTIGKNAWIGARATILPGVTIGENAVVGAASVVTEDVPANALVVGNPARVVKMLNE